MKLQGKCRICGKKCDDFFLDKGRVLCEKCFVKLANKHLHYKLKMRKINAILAKFAFILFMILGFVSGVAVGLIW